LQKVDTLASASKKKNKKKKNANKPKDLLSADDASTQRDNDDVSDEPETPIQVN
jgi:hypothetical protein